MVTAFPETGTSPAQPVDLGSIGPYLSAPLFPPCCRGPHGVWRRLSPPYLSAKYHGCNSLATCLQPESPIPPLTMRQLSLDANTTPTRRQGDASAQDEGRDQRTARTPWPRNCPQARKGRVGPSYLCGVRAAGPHTGRRSWGILSGRAARHDTPGTASDSWTAYRVRPQSAEWHGDIRDRRTPPQRTHRPPSRRRTNARSRR